MVMESERNPSLQIDLTKLEFLRHYGPDVTKWALSSTGRARVESGIFPPDIGWYGPAALCILGQLGTMEEDELGAFLDLTPDASKRLLDRLVGYGLVVQIGQEQQW